MNGWKRVKGWPGWWAHIKNNPISRVAYLLLLLIETSVFIFLLAWTTFIPQKELFFKQNVLILVVTLIFRMTDPEVSSKPSAIAKLSQLLLKLHSTILNVPAQIILLNSFYEAFQGGLADKDKVSVYLIKSFNTVFLGLLLFLDKTFNVNIPCMMVPWALPKCYVPHMC